MADLKGKSIVMIIASSNFRDEEMNVPLGFFRANGAEVRIASKSLNDSRGMLGSTVKPDMLYTDIDVSDFDAIVFVGGSGSSEYWNDPFAHRIAQQALDSNKVLAAICIAPVTLANAGILSGRKATVFPSEKAQLEKNAAQYTGNKVEVDGNVVTADGPQSAEKFAKEIAKLLTK